MLVSVNMVACYCCEWYSVCWQFVVAHLSFLQFILQEGGLYLPWHRARDIWDTLVASSQASDWDRDVRFCVRNTLYNLFRIPSLFCLN